MTYFAFLYFSEALSHAPKTQVEATEQPIKGQGFSLHLFDIDQELEVIEQIIHLSVLCVGNYVDML